MRVSEVVASEIRNIASDRKVIRVEHRQGAKGGYVMLSEQLLGILRADWVLTRPKRFCSQAATVTRLVPHVACRSARVAAGIDTRVSVHTRHAAGVLCHDATASRRICLSRGRRRAGRDVRQP
jgi:integrase/recombinase XerD